VLRGLTTRNATRENLARAAVEALLASLADAADRIAAACGTEPASGRVLLIGGGAKSPAVRHAAPGIFFSPVIVPEAEEYVALGAARQAAWALAGTAEPPPWPPRSTQTYTGAEQPQIRERHAALRDDTVTWDERTTP
jgi:xylulokinase